MSFLNGMNVVAIEQAANSALARLLSSFGATIQRESLLTVREVVSQADFLIDQIGAERLAAGQLSRDWLESANPKLIHVSVTPFGSFGPLAHWRGSELVASAMGGTLRATGDTDRVPVKEALDACWFHADMVAASGAMAALHERVTSGRGQHIDVSVQEVAFSRCVNSVLAWQFDRRKLHRAGTALNYGRATVRCIWPLTDGFCFHTLMSGRFGAPANKALSDWMDEVGVENPLRGTQWETYNRSTLDPTVRALWETAIEQFFRTRTRAQINTEGRDRGINATVLADATDVLTDPHLQARQFWREGLRGSGDRLPSRFVGVTEGSKTKDLKARTPLNNVRHGPLSGVRVLDFSWALVGSITTKVLGDLGCDVIKVESRTRPCLSRIDVQVNASRADSFDDKPWFAHLNTSKQSLALDMKQPASFEVIAPLIEWADVVVENFSPGTMAKLGLDYARLAARNPSIIMVSGSVFGQTGPLAHHWGVDGTGAALSGRTLLTGWPDREPVIPSAVPYGDVIVPYVMAAAVSAALARRQMSGSGCHIDASMYEICVQQMSDAIGAAIQGETLKRDGNRDRRVFHQGVYATDGDDRYVALTLETEDEWRTLQKHAQLDEVRAPSERDAALAKWFRGQRDDVLVAELQRLGFAAGVVQDIEDLMERDPQIKERNALITLDHALLGKFAHVRSPLSFSRSITSPYRAPSLGEHSERIATEIAGLTAARFAELKALGVFR